MRYKDFGQPSAEAFAADLSGHLLDRRALMASTAVQSAVLALSRHDVDARDDTLADLFHQVAAAAGTAAIADHLLHAIWSTTPRSRQQAPPYVQQLLDFCLRQATSVRHEQPRRERDIRKGWADAAKQIVALAADRLPR